MAIYERLAITEINDSTRHAIQTQANKTGYLLSKIERDVWVAISTSRGN